MGMIREYGYREYSDDLSPAKGGLSNLLFDTNRSLSTHADFHAVDREDEVDSREVADVVVGALAAVGVAALVYASVRGVRAVRAARAQRTAASAPRLENDEPACAVSAEDQAASGQVAEVDADDALIAEVAALCDENSAPLRPYRNVAPLAESPDDESRDGRSRERGRSTGR